MWINGNIELVIVDGGYIGQIVPYDPFKNMDDRDMKDLKDDNLRVYNFRGYTIFKLNKEHKKLYIGRNATFCMPIADDCKLMANFLLECEKYLRGEVDDVQSVEVN